jgi:hypothetical protein
MRLALGFCSTGMSASPDRTRVGPADETQASRPQRWRSHTAVVGSHDHTAGQPEAGPCLAFETADDQIQQKCDAERQDEQDHGCGSHR